MTAMNKRLSLILVFLLSCMQREEFQDLHTLNATICNCKSIGDIDRLKSKFHVELFLAEEYLVFKISNKLPQLISETLSLKVKVDDNEDITECQSRIETTGT